MHASKVAANGRGLRVMAALAVALVAGVVETVSAFVVLAGTVSASSERDTSPPRNPPHEWKDAADNVIARLDGIGRLTLFSWDAKNRLVRAEGMGHLYTPANARGSLGEAAWVHCWEFDDNDRAVREIGCDGSSHAFTAAEERQMDSRTWSTLKDHSHVRNAGWLGRFHDRRE